MRSMFTHAIVAATLAFTVACASAPKVKPTPEDSVPPPTARALAPAPTPPPPPEKGPHEFFLTALAAFDAGDYDAARQGFERVVEKGRG